MNYWFTADTHFGHANIIKYSKRPFADVVEMNETIISNWNNVVQDGDLVYHLGDFILAGRDKQMANIIFGNLFRRLKGMIILVKGNHDQVAWENRERFYSSSDSYREIEVNGQTITLCHYAQVTWNKKHHSAWMLCGHSHYNLPATRKEATCLGKILDVGVDGNDFKPYSFDEIKTIMDKKPLFSSIPELTDHHQ